MSVPFVDLNAIHAPIFSEINSAIKGVVQSNDFIKTDVVKIFEENFAKYIGVKHAVGCANGTDALELALEVLELRPEDEVIVPVHSWISTASAVLRVGAKVVFADTLYDEFTIDPKSIEEKITPHTKVIIVVHLYGNPCKMDEVIAIAQKNNLVIIEDCAQAHGATYKNQKVGSFGLMSCFSFYPSKNLGALGDGGAVLTNDSILVKKISVIANCGQSEKNEIAYMGRNSRLDAIQAAILTVKLKYLDDWNNSRIELAKKYSQLLEKMNIVLPIAEQNATHVYHLFVVKTAKREQLISKLKTSNIGYAMHYPFLLHELVGLRDGKQYRNASRYKEEMLSLPMYAFMKEEEIEKLKQVFLTID